MSGFVGIVNLDGAPVDRAILERLTASIAYRGPDAQETRIFGNAGFGHTMFRTTWEAAREHQPCALAGSTAWIAGDCRVDAREELVASLLAHGRSVTRDATDPELILHAWEAWDTACLEHLLGDFSFAIWDTERRRLFCARDHLGVRLFYYARKGNTLVFSNTLFCVRQHPAVTDDLNELTIADYLLGIAGEDQSTTAFRDISRLPPAHFMEWTGEPEPQVRKYWSVPADPPVRFRRRAEYPEYYLDLLRTCVRDRVRTDSVALFMSGGLDSGGLAVTLSQLRAERGSGRPLEINAFTNVYDYMLPGDRERHYAGMVAAHLGIPIHFTTLDEHRLFQASVEGNEMRIVDPSWVPTMGPAPPDREMGVIAGKARVALFGEGPDNAMVYEWQSYVRHELKEGRIGSVLAEAIAFPFLFRKLPFWSRLRRKALAKAKGHEQVALQPLGTFCFPPWMNADLVKRLNLRERYGRLSSAPSPPQDSAVPLARPRAHSFFSSELWESLFRDMDPGVSGVPLEVRHPYLDVRMIRFLLSVPVIPWCRDKYLMRRALKPFLPAETIRRPKTALAGFPEFELWKRDGMPGDKPVEALAHFVDLAALEAAKIDTPNVLTMALRPVGLNFFLRSLQSKVYTDGDQLFGGGK